MFMHKKIAGSLIAAALVAACASTPEGTVTTPSRGPSLGATPSAAMLAAMDTSIPPSGAGLPAGSGTVAQGAKVYDAKCQTCHGPKGAGKPADPLVGGIGSIASGKPMRTVGNYWPHATSVFDYVRRAMPHTAPGSLTNDEVYALTAFLLSANQVIAQDAVLDSASLVQVKMPYRDRFVPDTRRGGPEVR